MKKHFLSSLLLIGLLFSCSSDDSSSVEQENDNSEVQDEEVEMEVEDDADSEMEDEEEETETEDDSEMDDDGAEDAVITYVANVEPILAANCINCHGESRQNAGVRVDTYDFASENINSIIDAIKGVTSIMPPSGPLADTDISTIEQWLEDGLVNE